MRSRRAIYGTSSIRPARGRSRDLASELTLRRALEPDLPLLDQLPTTSPVEARVRIDAGHDLWIVLEGDRPLFSCWIFRGRTPTIAAPGGQLPLPADTVCLEDSVTVAAARGRGIAPAAWAAIADALAAGGARGRLSSCRSSRQTALRAE